MSFKSMLQTNRSLAVQINSHPSMTHKLKVLKHLRLEEGYEPEGISASTWKSILDHFDNDGSTALQRGVFYLVGDIVEVDRYEATDLLSIVPTHFEPIDELSVKLAEVVKQ